MNFEELVCYSQTVILVLLAIGYFANLRKSNTSPSKIESTCPSCNFKIRGKNIQYCGKCGDMLSHSEGLSLEK